MLVVVSAAAGSSGGPVRDGPVLVVVVGTVFLLAAGTRPLLRGDGVVAGASTLSEVAGVAVGVGDSSGVGCGVGAAATSSFTTGGSGSRAPTEDTRFEPLRRVASD